MLWVMQDFGHQSIYYILYTIYIYIYVYMVRRLAFQAPPPPPSQWYGLVRGGGGGAGVCGEGWGPLELQLEKRPGVTEYGCSAAAVYRVYSIELHIARCHLDEA